MQVKTALLIEDNMIIQMFTKQILTNLGLDVIGTGTNSVEALLSINIKAPDVLFVDIGLDGEMDGIEVVNLINTKFDIPVIYLTGSSNSEVINRANQTNPISVLLKPITEEMLSYHLKEAGVEIV